MQPWPKEAAANSSKIAQAAFDLEKRKREQWCWQPVHPQEPPKVKDAEWVRDPVDAFILSKLEEKDITPAPPAEKRVWLRRVTFDLTGLPPNPADIDAFLRDDSAKAYEKVVDRLLASPQFGERWARHWLDLVRYGDSRGHEFDPIIPNAYQYRDYVIRALNADVPYDQFVKEHLAGDLLTPPRRNSTEGFNESLIGSGFWFLGEEVHSPVDIRQDQADRYDNRIDVMTKTLLGLTVACARCHDHKFDAISQKDYYSLYGFLSSSNYRLARFDGDDRNATVEDELARARVEDRAAVIRALKSMMEPDAGRMADYLIAAREVILLGPQIGISKKLDVTLTAGEAETRKRLAQIAIDRKLDQARLEEWVAIMLEAAKKPEDPLYVWAKIAADPAAHEVKHLEQLLHTLGEEAQKKAKKATDSLKDSIVRFDYAKADKASWMPDGNAFGLGPKQVGDMSIRGDSAAPIIRFVERGSAEYDRAWDVLKLAPGAQLDPDGLGSLQVRSGLTIRTPSFRIAGGKMHYLVKGAGGVYAAVSGHVEINGPLHGQLLMKIPAALDYHWVSQDLTRYKGLDAHIEFTAAQGSDFAVAMIVEGEHTLALPSASVDDTAIKAMNSSNSLEENAKAYSQLFIQVPKELEQVGESKAAAAHRANWITSHTSLFANSKNLTETALASLARQKKLGAEIRTTSRLCLAMQDGDGLDEHIFIRGASKAEGEPAPRRLLEALVGPKPLNPAAGSGRLELALQITDPATNPFIVRVYVNRVWHHLFGRGIVASVDNFGVLGEKPTHPELLDFLANRFVKEGWSTKTLIRELVLSSSYRQSSLPIEAAEKADPSNLLLHRARLRRLEGEAIRDAMLSISGRLNPTMNGPSVAIHLTPFLDGRGRPTSGPLDGDGRRSIYLAVKRNFLSPMMLAFDTPSPFSTVGRRTISNVPAQALILMNDPFVHQQAALWAKRVLNTPGSTPERIQRMYVSAFGKPANNEEQKACEEFLTAQAERYHGKEAEAKAWADLAHALFNVKQFIYLE